ncbi:MAG TPA: PPOX class F420-dependent oxidoreductase, partial [Acidimicrobiales bacterium]|nr:PPOX class F420-dependent oxidoreductase [Acidimicrobiales bacterium]
RDSGGGRLCQTGRARGRLEAMDTGGARAFLRDHHQAVLATSRQDGRPQLSPVLVAIDDEGYVAISSRETAFKVRNLRRDPRATLCVLNEGFYGPWIYVDGQATIVSLPDAMEPLVAYYRALSGEHPDWDDYRQAMVRERRVVVRIEITRAGPDRRG